MTASTSSTGGDQAYGFIPEPGTSQTEGQVPEITARLNQLAQMLKKNIYGLSGYRTPAQSAALPLGSPNDPHTKAQAEDIGFGSQLRASAGQITNAELAMVGLWRPFDTTGGTPDEINHIQLLPDQGGPQESATPPKDTSSGTPPGTVRRLPGRAGAEQNLPGGPKAGTPQQKIGPDLNPADAIAAFFNGLWSSIVNKAEYAALAFVAIVGGFILIARGISRASHGGG